MALGELRLMPEQFYSLTPREFTNMLQGFRSVQECDFRDNWERTRRIMWAVLVPHQKKGSNLTPKKLMVFPWEKDEADQFEATDNELEEAAAAAKEWADIDARREAKRKACTLQTEKVVLKK